jgi:hypothetical protein
MTRRISITVTDEVAAILDQQENASAYISDSVQMRARRESVRQMLEEQGIQVTEEGVSHARRKLQEQRARRHEQLADEARRKAA